MKIGIIGGGQLGMMMAEAAHALGHTIIGLDPTPDCPLSFVTSDLIVAAYDDSQAFAQLASGVDVLTYEFENVDDSLVQMHESKIPQTSRALKVSKDRYTEKEFAKQLGIPIPMFTLVEKTTDLFFPAVLKHRTGGYDGKGQVRLSEQSDIDHLDNIDPFTCIIEEYIPYDHEISVIMTRSNNDMVVAHPIPINTHRDGILHVCEVTGAIPSLIASKAVEYTKRIIQELSYVGTLAVEYFVVGDTVLFNEFAPRPHNSGHYSIEGCNVSQFQNHIRAITGMELVVPVLKKPTLMINELGQDKAYKARIDSQYCTYHDYHKSPRKAQRKMGHITCVSNTLSQLHQLKQTIIGEPDEHENSN